MPSQEDYLDKLLKGIEGLGSTDEDSAADIPNPGDQSGMKDMPDTGILSDLGDLSDIGIMPDLGDLPNIGETPDMGDFFDLDDLPSLDDLPDISTLLNVDGLSDESQSGGEELSGGQEPVGQLGLGGMSETDVEQALEANRTQSQEELDLAADVEDLMSLLKGTDNSELQDIHDMLQKSDNNEALEETPTVEQTASASEEAAAPILDGPEEGGDGLNERQRKALEKKRLKEEKAAAKKAAKEAKKAEKLAKKAKKTQKQEQELAPDAEMAQELSVQEAGALQEQPALGGGDEEDDSLSVDMSAIDDLLGLDDEQGSSGDGGTADDNADTASKGKKKGLFAKILDFLTEEDEDEEEEQTEKGTENIPLSDENKNILAEMDQEESGKKGKKGKKAKKAKKGKAASANAEGEGEDEEDGGKKAKKAKKPPKEKKPKEDVPKGPKKKLPIKQLMPVILTCVTVLFVILLLVNLGGDFSVKRNARKAYYQQDYETCYQELYGRTLNESERVMFGKSESILRIRLWMREYELFSSEGAEVEALDILIQSVKDYAQLYEYAVKWNAGGEVSAVYGQMLDILQNQYGLTEAQALEIAAEPDDVEYTRLVTAAALGQGYRPGGADSSSPADLPHMLPEEKQFPENNGGR